MAEVIDLFPKEYGGYYFFGRDKVYHIKPDGTYEEIAGKPLNGWRIFLVRLKLRLQRLLR